MSDHCPTQPPAPGTVRQLNTAQLGSKFFKMHGRWVGDCPNCGRRGIAVTAQNNLRPHKPKAA
ncbi:hypothetical protein [Streptomyces sp. NBC_00212]|uniref:hypothetical protein n=1 Tax=Streptomyces sp. NBC_00212 TaxID=2975684 RepID=UPI002F91366A